MCQASAVIRKRTAPLPPKARAQTLDDRRQERRERLVEAAVTLFGEHGYHGVTVRDICGAAKLTERYFYESFPNLSALFVAAYQRANRPLRQRTLTALATAERTPLGLARAALAVYVHTVQEDPRAARILLFESVSIGGEAYRVATEATEDYVALLRSFLEAVNPQGLAGVRTEYLASALVGAATYAVMRWYREGFRSPAEEIVGSVFALYRGLEALHREERGVAPSLPTSAPAEPA